jgi:ABC-type nitrate/sulfonate/bicarbonate transport system substrate-binding protein
VKAKPDTVRRFLELLIAATDYINDQPELGYRSAADWIGTSLEVERKSMPTSGYSTVPDDAFRHGMVITWQNMVKLGKLGEKLKDATEAELDSLLCDFSLLEKARAELAKRRKAT